jgi:hypothetical protein
MDSKYTHEVDLRSSVQSKGELVTQIITFKDGVKKTFKGVKSKSIEQGQLTKFETEDGRLVMINDHNVLFIEIFSEDKSK